MDERQQLEKAITELESQRGVLSDDVIDASVVTLREKLAALQVPEQQRKLVTILYADIVGSTNIVKHLDPEDALEIMDGSLKRLAVPVEGHGGHVARFMGDGFKAVFGMPKAHENDPEMSIRAGLGILEVAQELGVELETQWGIHDIQVRVGINTGLAALGGMTEAEDTVMGSTVNLAKRVESAAPSGGLLITHNTYRHVRGLFDVERQEPIKAKGFDEPVPVYLVIRVKPRAFRVLTRGVEGIETRMVGREAELLSLQNAYQEAVEGEQTQVVTIVGEAGVGKSRLLYEFDNWIELLPDEVRFFQGHAMQETQQLPYAVLKDVFTFRFQIQDSDRGSKVRKKVEIGFGEIMGNGEDGQMRTHIIGQLLGFDFSDSPYLEFILEDPQQIHDRALMYLGEYLQGMSEGAPTVIFLEDIHWADDSSLDMVNRLARMLREQHLLIVCLARHRLYERRPYWGEGLDYHTRLELRPLTKSKSRGLVKEILKKVNLVPQEIQELVVKGAEGNPFYIEELIKMLVEDGIILTGEEQWHIEPTRLAEIVVPDTLTGVLQARLEGLPPEERTTLQQASVVGHIFWDDSVAYIHDESRPSEPQTVFRSTGDTLTSLRARELVYHREESAFAQAGEYTFKHAVLRDVAYESVLKRLRKAYHGLVAEWLIQHSEDRANEFIGLIADHLELAGKEEQAAIYLYQTGEGAAKRYANDEAVEYFTRALDLTPEDDLVGRYDLLLACEKVRRIQGDREPQKENLAALQEITTALNDAGRQADVALRQMIYLYDIADFPAVVEMVEGALVLTQAACDMECEAAMILRWGMSLWQLGRNEAAQPVLEHALELAREHQLFQVEGDSLRCLGNIAGDMGDEVRSISLTKQALDKYRRIGDKRGEAAVLNNIGVRMDYKYDYQSAGDYYEQALQINREIGDRGGEGLAYDNLGCSANDLCDFDKAIELLSQSLEVSREIGDRLIELDACNNLGWAYFYTGEYEKSEACSHRCMEVAHQIGLRDFEIMARARLARFYSSLGDFTRAKPYFENMVEVGYEFENQIIEAWVYLHYGCFKYQVGDIKSVLEYCRQFPHFFVDRKLSDFEWQRLMLLGHTSTILGELAEAEEFYNQAASLGVEMHRQRRANEAQAGLARVNMARGEVEQALTQVEEILDYMQANTPRKRFVASPRRH